MNRPQQFPVPTDEEIDLASRTMLPDMNGGTADKMGQMTLRNRMLQYQIRGLLKTASRTVETGAMTPAMAMESAIAAAVAYGLHLGIHVGMMRGTKETTQ